MAHADVAVIAELHRRIFPDYFLSHTGLAFLRSFYQEFVDHEGNYSMVASSDGTLVGFVAGTRDANEFYRRFYRQRFLLLFLLLAVRFVVDPYIRRALLSRLTHVDSTLR